MLYSSDIWPLNLVESVTLKQPKNNNNRHTTSFVLCNVRAVAVDAHSKVDPDHRWNLSVHEEAIV